MKFKPLAVLTAAIAMVGGSVHAEDGLVTQWLDGKVSPPPIEVTYDGAPITIRFSSFGSPQAPISQVMARSFARLEAETNGKLVVRPFWSNSLANSAEGGFDAVSSGVADIGTCYSFMSPGGFMLQLGLQMPFMIEASVPGSLAATEVYGKFLREGYEARDVYLARVAMTPPNQLLSRGDPVVAVGDLAGKRIWAVGDIPTQVATALGASAIPLAPGELYTSFQTGIIDLVPMHDAGVLNFRLDELAKHRTLANLSANATEFCMNRAFFDGLPEDLKAIFYRWLQLSNHAEAELYFDAVAARGREAMEEQGVEFHTLSPEETGKMQALIEPVVTGWTQRMQDAGQDGAGFLDAFEASYAKFAAMSADDAFRAAMEAPVPDLVSGYTFGQ